MHLSPVDVEWADGEGGGLRKSVLEAVSQVPLGSVLPGAEVHVVRAQRHFAGCYWAATTASLVGFESWLERDRAILFDHDRRVVGLASQPFRVTWQGTTRQVSHTPDYFARLEDGSGLVVDVRPAGPGRPGRFGQGFGDRGDVPGDGLLVLRAGARARSGGDGQRPLAVWLSASAQPIGDVPKRLMDTCGDARLLMDGAAAVGAPVRPADALPPAVAR
ncbi:TnsA-like heteromeric transposase endonuclease subunit [Streptomyces deccanensis]|uniref:TnsA-like heteromeric transposase endonuclease subunit n=1 Tax=Streptomyces deccanensis TaxID=424188 RepID=UPI003B846964